jgi:hypothetical protein
MLEVVSEFPHLTVASSGSSPAQIVFRWVERVLRLTVLKQSNALLVPWPGNDGCSRVMIGTNETYDDSSVDDIEIALRVCMGARAANTDVVPLPYREVELPKKLKFGYYVNGNTTLRSPCETILRIYCRRLRQGIPGVRASGV